MRHRTLIRLVGTVVGLAIALSGCGDGASSSESRDRAIAEVRLRSGLTKRSDLYRNLEEALPNVRFRDQAGREITAVHAVVAGRVVESRDGSGYVDGTSGSEPVAFSSPKADWRSVYLRVEVEEVLGASGDHLPDVIWVGYSIGAHPDGEQIRRGFGKLGRVVLFLDPAGFYPDNPEAMVVHEDGALTGLVDEEDGLRFPMREEEREFMGSVRTMADLRSAASAGERTVEVSQDRAYLFPPDA